MEETAENFETAIVLHEDKKYYPDADEVIALLLGPTSQTHHTG
jgi:hypothetical protein